MTSTITLKYLAALRSENVLHTTRGSPCHRLQLPQSSDITLGA